MHILLSKRKNSRLRDEFGQDECVCITTTLTRIGDRRGDHLGVALAKRKRMGGGGSKEFNTTGVEMNVWIWIC